MNDAENSNEIKNAATPQEAKINAKKSGNLSKNKTLQNVRLTFLEKIAAKKAEKGKAQSGILLPSENQTLKPSKKTPVRDPLFAAKILKRENSSIKNTKNGNSSLKKASAAIHEKQIAATSKSSFIKNIRTYQSDVAEQIKNQKTSVVQMVLQEKQKKEEDKAKKSAVSKKNMPFFIMSLFFAIAGILIISAGVWYYFLKNNDGNEAVKNSKINSIIFAETQKEIDITNKSKDEIIKSISQEIVNLDIRLDFIEYIYPTKEIAQAEKLGEKGLTARASAQEFFKKLEFNMPDSLLRSLGDDFMIGVHSFNGNQPFIILTTDFFENTFAGMLVWEKFIANDILPLFAIKTDSNILRKKFEDRVIKNRDMRVLTDNNGEMIIFYSFYDKNTLIIATSKDTFDEIISRLQRM